VAVASSLFTRALRICNYKEGEVKEIQRIFSDLKRNNYSHSFISRTEKNIRRKLAAISDESIPVTAHTQRGFASYAVIPFVPIVSEKIARVLRTVDIRPVYKPSLTIGSLLHKTRAKLPTVSKRDVVYEVHCSGCSSSYVGQTGRALSTRLNEHQKYIVKSKQASALAEHAISTSHSFDFSNPKVLDVQHRYFNRIFSEAWEIASRRSLTNRSSGAYTIPNQYFALF
jgi:hypothetical protein